MDFVWRYCPTCKTGRALEPILRTQGGLHCRGCYGVWWVARGKRGQSYLTKRPAQPDPAAR